MQKKELSQVLAALPLLQRLSLIEEALQTIKDEMFVQTTDKHLVDIRAVYQFFVLANQTTVLQTLAAQPLPPEIHIQKGNKKLNPKALFGIWEDNPRTLEDIRRQDWSRDWGL